VGGGLGPPGTPEIAGFPLMAWPLLNRPGRRASMRGKVVFAVTLAMAVGLCSSAARACGGGGSSSNNYTGLAVAALVIAASDVAMTIYDGGAALTANHPPAGYGLVEVLVAGPQLALGLVALRQSYQDPYGNQTSRALLMYSAWMALLTVHGIWTISTAPYEGSAPLEVREPSSALQRRAPQPALQIGVGPTYVPLGPLSQPGLGLVGRF
jgi:hypothetical protein